MHEVDYKMTINDDQDIILLFSIQMVKILFFPSIPFEDFQASTGKVKLFVDRRNISVQLHDPQPG